MTHEAKTPLGYKAFDRLQSPLDYSGTKTVKILYVDLTAGGQTLSNSLKM